MYTVSQKVDPTFSSYLCQILADFQNSFTDIKVKVKDRC